VPPRRKPRLAHPYEQEVDDVTPANRDLMKRTVFLAAAREPCFEHRRYAVDRFALVKSKGKTIAKLTRCCPEEDQTLELAIAMAPVTARQYGDEILERTKPPAGAAYEMHAENFIGGFERRLRGDALTLEATLSMAGAEKMRDAQLEHLTTAIDAAGAAGKLACPVHGDCAIEAVHTRQTKDATVVDLVVCCKETHGVIMAVQLLVDDALLSGTVVSIAAAEGTKRKRLFS
jgi:hypothetical protein